MGNRAGHRTVGSGNPHQEDHQDKQERRVMGILGRRGRPGRREEDRSGVNKANQLAAGQAEAHSSLEDQARMESCAVAAEDRLEAGMANGTARC